MVCKESWLGGIRCSGRERHVNYGILTNPLGRSKYSNKASLELCQVTGENVVDVFMSFRLVFLYCCFTILTYELALNSWLCSRGDLRVTLVYAEGYISTSV